ncbi:MAG: ABC transporter ATP-binding protein [Cryobacterium sp.]|nr:ABC transporter ATP-binding protein [Oligoflexia bacterium]
METVLETRALIKRYSDLTAVDGLDLRISEGACFGLLGPNGAGKTTTLEMIEGILPPTSGEILYRGEKIGRKFSEEIGIQFQSTALPDFLRVHEVLKLFSAFYQKHMSLNELKDLCDLGDFWNRDASKLSGGQRQRVLLALALVNDPSLVFLDEPTTGLDPQARRRFWELVGLIRKRGKTIVLTTHYMEEAYELCDSIAIMNHGKIIAEGTPNDLLKQHFHGISIRLPKGGGFNLTPDNVKGAEVFDRGEAFEVLTEDPNTTLQRLIDLGIPLKEVQIRSRNLEDLFLKLTGKGFHHEEASRADPRA